MRLAILADIHANLPALEAVLRDVAGRGVEGLLHLGDLVGYGPHPEAVVARVREQEIAGVVGNYDLAVCHPDAEEGAARYLRPDLSEVGWQTYRWTRARVGAATREVLSSLPAQLHIEEGARSFLLTHGSPERPDEYLLPDTPEARLRELFEGSGADVLVVGHTHLPQAREVGNRLLLNAPGFNLGDQMVIPANHTPLVWLFDEGRLLGAVIKIVFSVGKGNIRLGKKNRTVQHAYPFGALWQGPV